MKLLSYSRGGVPSWGAVINGRVVDLQAASQGRAPTLRSGLEQFALRDIEALAKAHPATIDLAEIEYLPVITEATKIFCVGLNYDEHRIEANRDKSASPTLFVRFAASQTGHNRALLLPRESDKFDYEGEIAVIIGCGGRRIAEEAAWEHVAGYAPRRITTARSATGRATPRNGQRAKGPVLN